MTNLVYVNPDQYRARKKMFIKKGKTFKECFSGLKKHLAVTGTKYYYSTEPREDNATKLGLHELGLIGRVKNQAMSLYAKREEGPLPYRIGHNLYVGQTLNNESFDTEDIYEVDISLAYPSAALLDLKILSAKNYEKFLQLETDNRHIIRKKKLRKKYPEKGGQYFTTIDGQEVCLRYSKKCRLIALGTLAQKKRVDYWANGKKEHSELEYNEQRANLFFNCGYTIGTNMVEIAQNISGVYFWWVDAIFCKKSAVGEVEDYLHAKGYNTKTKRCIGMAWNHREKRAEVVKESDGVAHPYSFSHHTHLDHHKLIVATQKPVKAIVAEYLEYLAQPRKLQKRIIQKAKEIYGSEASPEQLVFSEMCDTLGITHPSDMDMHIIIHNLKVRGLDYRDFMRIKTVTKSELNNTALQAAVDSVFGKSEKSVDMITMRMVTEIFRPSMAYTEGKKQIYKPHPTIKGHAVVSEQNRYLINHIKYNGMNPEDLF